MTLLDLIKKIKTGLEDALKTYKFPAQYSQAQTPNVFALSLPTGNVLEKKLYPLVMIEATGATHNAQIQIATLLLTLGTYKENGGGAVDNLIMAEAVQNWLTTHKLLGAASMLPDFEFMAVESDSDEFIFSQLLVNYKILKMEENYLR